MILAQIPHLCTFNQIALDDRAHPPCLGAYLPGRTAGTGGLPTV